MINEAQFDVLDVDLKGKNLVEASAGTGKTYSIAILILRLIIEKKFTVDQLLVVTFTKAAVAELQERVRSFIRMAYDYACGRAIDDETIKAVCEPELTSPELKERLRAALLLIDEATIATIHGFCQEMLREFAFETKQNFNATLQEDIDDYIHASSANFWRKELSILPIGLFELKDYSNLKKNVNIVLKKGLNEVPFVIEEELKADNAFEKISTAILEVRSGLTEQLEGFYEYIRGNESLLLQEMRLAKAHKSFVSALSSPEKLVDDFLKKTNGKKETKYIIALEGALWQSLRAFVDEQNELQILKDKLAQILLFRAYEKYLPQLEKELQDANVHTFDGLINNLHQAIVVDKNIPLKMLIRARFPAVFIDEFQDTDFIQFELFQSLFMESTVDNETILFLIGDPKQSIYAFRNADVDSYLKASSEVDFKYTMNVNFRSSVSMINAANHFFEAQGTHTFGYDASETRRIDYRNVASNKEILKIFKNGDEQKSSILIAQSGKKDDSFFDIVATISELLSAEQGYTIAGKDGVQRAVQPDDIAILVRSKKDGSEIKSKLIDVNIPAITFNDQKVFETAEAQDLALLLQTFALPNLNNVKSVLCLSFLQGIYFSVHGQTLPILTLNEMAMMELFKSYSALAKEQNVLQALLKLFSDFSVQQYLSQNIASQRRLTNLLQLAEILHEQQYRNDFGLEDLVLWLRQSINDEHVKEDEYTQQIESDEQAIRILTIHKSKGLEFPIVFVYGIQSERDFDKDDLFELRSIDELRVSKHKAGLSEIEKEMVLRKADQELRRLVYVALTRSVYRCYIFYSTGGSKSLKDGVLSDFLESINETDEVQRSFNPPKLQDIALDQSMAQTRIFQIEFDSRLAEQSKSNWGVFSFSSLSARHEYELKAKSSELSGYDHFIFNQVARGTDAGTALHEIFEKIDFTKDYQKPEEWPKYIRDLINKLSKGSRNIKEFEINFGTFLQQVLNARIEFDNSSFALSEIPIHKRLEELEFNFPVGQSHVHKELKSLLARYDTGIDPKYFNLNGMLTGFIDLVFEHDGRYYILDWKSNYLGFELEDYQNEALKDAMIHQQYILQYLIYTVALNKYLTQRLGASYNYDQHFGGVVYVFLRAARAGSKSGIYTDIPNKVFIEELSEALTEDKC